MFTRHKLVLPNGEPLTSLVMDEKDFDELLEMVRQSGVMNIQEDTPVDDDQIQRLRDAQIVPLIKRGKLTESIFIKFGVNTNYMNAVIRGAGMAIAAHLMADAGGYRH